MKDDICRNCEHFKPGRSKKFGVCKLRGIDSNAFIKLKDMISDTDSCEKFNKRDKPIELI